MKIVLKYTLHSDPLPPEPALDLHPHELVLDELKAFLFNIYGVEQDSLPPPPPNDYRTFRVINPSGINIRIAPITIENPNPPIVSLLPYGTIISTVTEVVNTKGPCNTADIWLNFLDGGSVHFAAWKYCGKAYCEEIVK